MILITGFGLFGSGIANLIFIAMVDSELVKSGAPKSHRLMSTNGAEVFLRVALYNGDLIKYGNAHKYMIWSRISTIIFLCFAVIFAFSFTK